MGKGATTGRATLTPYQFGIILLCMFVNMLDGYDVFIMGYALPSLPEGYATSAEKGYLISAALAGLGVGAIFLARLADHYGRRPAVIGALALNLVSLFISAVSPNYTVLITSRFFTGMAVGILGVVAVTAAQEFAPSSRKSLAIGIVYFGYPLGSLVAGLTGAVMISAGGWKALFWVGVALCAIALIAALAMLPETPPFLRRSTDEKSKRALEKLMAKLNFDDASAAGTDLAPDAPDDHAKVYLLGRQYRTPTLLLWAGYVFVTAGYYFIGTWTPQLIKDATGEASAGVTAGIMVSIGTMIGALVYGFAGMRRPSAQVSWFTMIFAMASLVGFALTLTGPLALVLAACVALFTYAGLSAYAGIANTLYPVLARAKGFGAMLGVGRVGAIMSPILGGYAVGFMSTKAVYLWVVVPLALAGLFAFALTKVMRPQPALDATVTTNA